MNHQVQLCPIIEGVQFPVCEGHATVRGLILREALQAHFGADDSPQSWLRAYAAHAELIHAAALMQHRARPGASLVVLRAERPGDLPFNFPFSQDAAA